MKGTPVFPQCGFSSLAVQVLSHLGVKFKAIDVLSDPALRQGIKAFSDWPSVPQLYVKGEFVGGCDIVREMFETGELAQFLAARGVKTATVPPGSVVQASPQRAGSARRPAMPQAGISPLDRELTMP